MIRGNYSGCQNIKVGIKGCLFTVELHQNSGLWDQQFDCITNKFLALGILIF